MVEAPTVFVVGRVSYDLNPVQAQTHLEEVTSFERSVGGFAGNVATGLSRLGVQTWIVSAVGDDPHGRYIRAFLDDEQIDTTWLKIDPVLRTALAFYESWPPDNFPITLFRTPTCPDWELDVRDVPLEKLAAADGVVVSGTGLARDLSFATTLALVAYRRAANPGSLTVLDLDWRPMVWTDDESFARRIRVMIGQVDVVVGGDAEFVAAGLTPESTRALGPRVVILKRGAAGAAVYSSGARTDIPGVPVSVTCALGAGDAFVAALTAALLDGQTPPIAGAFANASGAIVAARPMCSSAMPRREEVDLVLGGATVANGTVTSRSGR